MKRPFLRICLTVLLIIVILFLAGSFIIYSFPDIFEPMHQGNFTVWLLAQLSAHPFLTSWIWLLILLVCFLGGGSIICLLRQIKKGGKRSASAVLFHLGFALALLGFCLDSTFGVRSIKLRTRPEEEIGIPGFPEISIKVSKAIPLGVPNDSGAYKGIISLRKGNKNLKETEVSPNHPLLYLGMAVYLTGVEREWQGIRVKINETNMEIFLGRETPIPGIPYNIRLDQLIPHLGIGKDGRVFSQSQEMGNPAAQISLISPDGGRPQKSGWIFQRFEHMNPLAEQGIKITWVSNLTEEGAIVHFSHHPGLWLVIFGVFLALCANIILLLRIMPHQKPFKS